MKLCGINPFLRYGALLPYRDPEKTVKVTDCRIFYVRSGSAWVRIGQQHTELLPRSLFFCCAGSTYTIGTGSGVDLICLNFDLTWDHSHLEQPFSTCTQQRQWDTMPVHSCQVEDSPFLEGHLYMENAEELLDGLLAITACFSGKEYLYRERCGALLKDLLLQLHRLARQQRQPKLEQVRGYLHTHFREPITNRQLADMVGYHDYYLNRIFTAYTGLTLHQYLLRVRLSQAVSLIRSTQLSLTAIPEQVGFQSYPHFSACFKKAYGQSPTQYRKHLHDVI